MFFCTEFLHYKGYIQITNIPLIDFQAILKRSLKPTCAILPLMKRGHANNLEFFLSHVGKVYMNGLVLKSSHPHRINQKLSAFDAMQTFSHLQN